MKRLTPKVLLINVLLLLLNPHIWAQSVPAPQTGSFETSQAIGTARYDWVPTSYPLAAPPQLSPEQLQRLERALERTHRPDPALPVDPTTILESIASTSPSTQAQAALDEGVSPMAPQDFRFFTNQDLGSGAPSGFTSNVNEPSVGNSGDVVFQSGNWYAALSTDGGQTFSFVDPFTGPFPPVNDGFCCDQIVIYDPSRNALFWLQQYIEDGNSGTHRINVDQGADGTFDCAYDFTPQLLGLPNGRWFDFPDLVLGSNFLYHTSNVFHEMSSFATEAMIARYPLDQIAACAASFNFNFFVSNAHFSFRATHGAGSTVYWGAHNSTHDSIRIYRWDETSSTIFVDDRTISTWNNATRTCAGPDGKDWCGRADARINGAYVANGVIGFMWSASQGGSFPYPYVQIARFGESDRGLIDQPQIWSTGNAWIYPSVGVNGRDHIAGTILAGGGSFFPMCQAWIADDINGGVLAPLENYNAVTSTSGPNQNRSGDYLASRPHSPNSNTWIGTCFSLQGGGDNSNARPRFVWFGRERDSVGVPSLSINDVTANEGNSGTTPFNFTVTLSPASSQTVTVQFATANGTATAGSDYVAIPLTTLTFNPGETSKPIPVQVNGDTVGEPNETFFVNLSNATNATISDNQGLGTIVNDDCTTTPITPGSTVGGGLTDSDCEAPHRAGKKADLYTFSATAGQQVTIAMSSSVFDTYLILVGPNGNVVVDDDDSGPGTDSLISNFPLPSSGTYTIEATAFADGGRGAYTLSLNVTQPTLSINDVTANEGNSGTTPFNFTVTLSPASSQTVTVQFATANGTATAGSDYVAIPLTTLTFNPGETSKPIPVQVNGDTLNEPNETFFVNLSNATNATISDGQGVGTINNDDPQPTLSINDVAVAEGNAGTVNGAFTVSLSAASGETVTVNFATANGTATAGSDYVSNSGTLTFNPEETSKPITIQVNGDTILCEPNETFFVNLSNATNATISDGQGVGTINNDDPLPSISINDVAGNEGDSGTTTLFNFTVSLSGACVGMVTVQYATANGTATAGSDYVAIPLTTLTFNPGETSKPVTVQVNGDTLNEANETFFVNLSNAANATISDGQGQGTITNDDATPTVTLNLSGSPMAEAGGTATVTATLSAVSGKDVTVNLAFSGTATLTSDYTRSGTSISIPAGSTTGTITLTAVQDSLDEANETIIVDIDTVVNATESGTQQVTAIITDDDAAPAVAFDASSSSGAESVTPANLAVSLSAASGQTVTVDYAVTGGTATGGGVDYTLANGTLSFSPGETTKNISITIVNDSLDEANETIQVTLSNPSNATLGATTVHTYTITDDDLPPTVSLGLSGSPMAEAGGTATVTATLSAVSGKDVTVNLAFSGTATLTSDYTRSGTSISIPAGSLSGSITLTAVQDSIDEANETIIVDIDTVTNATESGVQQVTAIITDDDPAPTVAFNAASSSDLESVSPVNVPVSLSAGSGLAVTVNYAVSGGTATGGGVDYTLANGTLTFNPGETTKNIQITVVNDTLDEENETIQVTLSSPVNATLGATTQHTYTVTDDDTAPSLSINDVMVTEGNVGTVNAVFTVSLSAASGQTVTVQFATADGTATAGSDYVAVPLTTLTFNPGETSKTVTVQVNGDTLPESNETFFVNLSGATNATISDGQGQGTILDDDPVLPTVTISATDATATEAGPTTGAFRVSRTGSTASSLTVFYSVGGTATAGADYTALPGSVTIPAGLSTADIIVTPINDSLMEGNETVIATLSPNAAYTIGSPSSATVTIVSNERVTISAIDSTATEAGPTTGAFRVSRTGSTASSLTVFYSVGGTATPGSDYTALPGSVTIPAGLSTANILVTPVNDLLMEGNETVVATLTPNAAYTVGTPSSATVTISSDEKVTISATDATATEAGPTTGTFRVSRTGSTAAPLTVFYTVGGTATKGSDYTALPGSMTIPVGSSTAPITVTPINDALMEGNETVVVTLSPKPTYTVGTPSRATVTISSDEKVTIAATDPNAAEAGLDPGTFTVSRTGSTAATLTVNYTVSGTATKGSDYTALPGSVTIPAGSSSAPITVTPINDALMEGNETVVVTLTPRATYTVGTPSSATVTISSDE